MPLATVLLRVGLLVALAGLVAAVWYLGWGVHGCDDFEGNPLCDRMERDFAIFRAGVAALGIGLLVAAVAALRGGLAPRDGGHQPQQHGHDRQQHAR